MQYNPPAYYRPYSPENDGNTESDDYSDSSSDDKSDAGGPKFNTTGVQEKYEKDGVISAYSPMIEGLEVQQTPTLQSTQPPSQPSVNISQPPLYISNPTKRQTSLLSVRSKDRNKTLYPTPFQFSLNTPRVYKNISQIQCVQITFPNIANYVIDLNVYGGKITSLIKQSYTTPAELILIQNCEYCADPKIAGNSFGIHEYVINSASPPEYVRHAISVPAGSYNPSQLVAELNRRTNRTPPFNIISLGNFTTTFNTTLDISCLFNEGGTYLYNTLDGSFKANPTKDDIIVNYYPKSYKKYGSALLANEAFVAYHYPSLKEAVMNPIDRLFLAKGVYTDDQLMSLVVCTFQGFASAIYLSLCQANEAYLLGIRRKHTFEYNLLNQYDWYYDSKADRIGLRVSRLNLSIRKDIEKQRQILVIQALVTPGGTYAAQFAYVNTALTAYVFAKYGAIFPNPYLTATTFLSEHTVCPVVLDMKSSFLYQGSPFASASAGSCCKAIQSIIAGAFEFMPPNYPNTLGKKMGFGVAEFVVNGSILADECPFPNHNLYIQLDTSRPLNRMDVISEEERMTTVPTAISNYKGASIIGNPSTLPASLFSIIDYQSNAPQGESNAVLGKILFTDQPCMGISQTMIQNPVRFKPYYGKMDKFVFNILLDDQLIPLNSLLPYPIPCVEWDAVFQIDEQVNTLSDADSSHVPTVPSQRI